MRKKIICSILITLILTMSFFTGYSKYSYADNPIEPVENFIGKTYQINERGLTSIFLYLRSAGIRISSAAYNNFVDGLPVAYQLVEDFCNSPYNIDTMTSQELLNAIGEYSGFTENIRQDGLNHSNFKYDTNALYYLNQIYNYYVDGVRVDLYGEGQLKMNGYTLGYNDMRYCLFKYNGSSPYDPTDFSWGSSTPLGQFGYLNVTGKISRCTCPWGSETLYKSVSSSQRQSKLVQGGAFDWQILYNEINDELKQIGSPCLVLIGNKIYKGGVYFDYIAHTYKLSYGSTYVYKTLNSPDLADFDWAFLNTSDPSSSTGTPSDTYTPPAVPYNPSDPTSYPSRDVPAFEPKYYYYDVPQYTPDSGNWGDPVGTNPMLPDIYRYIGKNPAEPTPELPDPENDIFNPPSDDPITPSDPTTITPNTPNAGGNQGTDTVGGGGGSDNPLSSDGTINFPNFDFNLPNINWSIGDVKEKFPFSIPFDLVAFYTVLNAEPQAPAIDRTIPLGFTDWRFQADFSQFENYATIIRNVEYIGFCVFLIYLTIRFVKG